MTAKPKLYAIYNADGSFLGELRYVKDKCFGNADCALCDLSHGWNPLGKSAFKRRQGVALNLDWVHRNELPEDVLVQVEDHLPCIARVDDGVIDIVISSEALKGCSGDFRVFEHLLERKLGAFLTP